MHRNHETHALPTDSDEGSGGQPVDMQAFVNAVRYWWKIAAPSAVALAVVAALAVWYFSHPQYTASAWLIIREKPEYLLNPQVMEAPGKFVQNQMELMRSPPVTDPVANKAEVFATPELSRSGEPAELLRRQLRVRAMGQSDFFVIEFTSEDPKKAALVVNEVAKSYLVLQDRDLSLRMEATITRLEKQRADQQQSIESLRDRVQQKTKTLTGVDPFIGSAQGVAAAIQDPLSPLQNQIVGAEIDQAMTAAQVEAEEEMLKRQVFEVPASEVEAKVQSLPEIAGLRKRIGDTQGLLKEHERTSANLAKNQAYQYLLKQKRSDETQFAKRVGELREAVKADLEKSSQMKRIDEVASMRKSLEAKQLAVTILRDRLEKERANQQVFKGETVELEFLRSDYEAASKVFEAINDRIVSMRLEQHAPDRVLRFKDATPPLFPDEALPYKKMAGVAAIGFFIPFGLAIAFELLHRRVSSRRQLELTCRVPVVAEVTEMPRRISSNRPSAKEQLSRELHLFEESIYGLRTHLMLAHATEGLCTVAVTSAVSREGKTSVAVQLAVSIARSTGEPTLLIDGDLRAPDIHRIFEVDRSPGLCEVLQGSPLEDAIESQFTSSLHLLTAGQLATVAHRLLGNGEFPRLLEDLKKKYRYIVIDTPPILAASEALMIARAADATVVCARRDFSRVDQVSEAYVRLRSANVKIAGTVLNGIPPKVYSYRYGSYYYDRGFQHDMAVATGEREYRIEKSDAEVS
ncbi:MAG: polysaccharide biosynthesis tyrosine autokinase [Pirellulaceae bacterium]